jgi:cytochrome c-type biogenesis protein
MSFMAFMEAMGTSEIGIIAAFFIGLMMAISPCPLVSNITAIAYASKNIKDSNHTILVGLFYTLGRMTTYVIIASAIVWFGINTQIIALFLQKYAERILGPFLIIIGIVMLDIIRIKFLKVKFNTDRLKEWLSKKGLLGAFFLGFILALAFCPFSAVLFFGMLIPLAISSGDGIIIPAVFAIATGLPVIIFSFILVKSVSKLGVIMNKLNLFEKYASKTIAIIFLAAGIYYTIILL